MVKTKTKEFNIPYIDIKAFEKDIIKRYTNDPKSVICNSSNILLVWDGARMGLVGKGKNGAVGSTLVKIDTFRNNVNFIYYLLKSKFDFFNSNPKQSGLPHLNGSLLNSMVVGLPSIEEQETIVDKINYMMNMCDELQNEIKLNKEYSGMLMQAVLKESFNKESV